MPIVSDVRGYAEGARSQLRDNVSTLTGRAGNAVAELTGRVQTASDRAGDMVGAGVAGAASAVGDLPGTAKDLGGKAGGAAHGVRGRVEHALHLPTIVASARPYVRRAGNYTAAVIARTERVSRALYRPLDTVLRANQRTAGLADRLDAVATGYWQGLYRVGAAVLGGGTGARPAPAPSAARPGTLATSADEPRRATARKITAETTASTKTAATKTAATKAATREKTAAKKTTAATKAATREKTAAKKTAAKATPEKAAAKATKAAAAKATARKTASKTD